ncbi:unnamed protein product [Merluccius merluccius]
MCVDTGRWPRSPSTAPALCSGCFMRPRHRKAQFPQRRQALPALGPAAAVLIYLPHSPPTHCVLEPRVRPAALHYLWWGASAGPLPLSCSVLGPLHHQHNFSH